ncbi:Pentapeptide repeat protein [Hyella patelloides LEGE 07179]|uniref:Pentapeptide repeat protein n=1 Tax=Hyella patelloides LEGE 07179 TaxID=945734 RepID=A0A563VJT1_9CYAN|nr:pentapeptide repeat-containing protein [Hyella patelloides]VEP11689.1 Pentapeptide repeat protein [Hyella patelloides LEGE 07179]
MSNFIATEPLGVTGEKGEQIVWNSIKSVFAERDCLAYWRYPIFDSQTRKEPDILIADYDLGLIVIEVKTIKINQIENIQGYRWQYKNFYTEYGNPYQQATNQLFSLLKKCDREPILTQQVTARVLIALPDITEQQWQDKGFHLLLSNPPILFKDSLANSAKSYQIINQAPYIRQGNSLTVTQWELLQAILAGTPVYLEDKPRDKTRKANRSIILQQARSRLSELDLLQEKIAKQIPPGMQRIRGVAGSGKTVLLCQKAALMSLKYPNWKIALVFFSRSLYDTITKQVDKWIRYYSQDRQQYNLEKSNLKIMHAWGSKTQPGFYSTICKLAHKYPLSVNNTISKKPNEALAEVCTQLLETTAITQSFDAILIDEAQDLIVDNWRYQDKQPFYWLAYQALRPVSPINPSQKRLIWAYDEIQSLDSLKIPDAVELFGESLGHLVTGKYSDEIHKTEILTRCYRTPQQIILTANAIAIGLLRKKGLLIKLRDSAEWLTIGYEIIGEFKLGQEITVKYNSIYAPNPIAELWQQNIIDFEKYSSRQQELTVLANNLNYNLNREQLQPSQELLVIVLGSYQEAIELQQLAAKFLMRQGINVYIPGSNTYNFIPDNNKDNNPNLFWHPGAVTISTIHRTKGQEADLLYLIGLDNIAKNESNIYLRNQLFIALTRTRGWAYLSGISDYEFYSELTAVINSKDTLKFIYQEDFKREIGIGDRTSILKGYAMGRMNFRYANLQQADLSHKNLANINLIAADLSGANLTNTNLSGAKLIEANLTNTNLTNANLSHAKLMGANLKNAILSGTNIHQADLTNIIF